MRAKAFHAARPFYFQRGANEQCDLAVVGCVDNVEIQLPQMAHDRGGQVAALQIGAEEVADLVGQLVRR